MRKIVMFVGVLLVAIVTFNLVDRLLAADTSENKEGQGSFVSQEQLSMATLKDKLRAIYVGVDVKTTPKKELVLQVVADEDYFNLVTKDMEPIAKSVIANSPFMDYTLVFERWELTSRDEEDINLDNRLSNFIKTIVESLESYTVFKHVTTDYQSFITIQTTIDSSEKDAEKLALEMEETVYEIINFQNRNEQSQKRTYDIKIVSAQGKVLNQ
ncbi:hypothetical protein FC756_03930 [Lysinibacillus mangiferihumi]|uniref:DUF4030 domain-containing protein n=1 Tax=Lysinibacillus mangiferihumi TaxID=1130819 RepID=A0A4U2ZEB2_9BACI|nr:hypothetical protein [Lysinibacillus mangiferihumi]TKI71950.1 hypothetical protein FC756_03930 [Lysinibacillus mangiferihumi]